MTTKAIILHLSKVERHCSFSAILLLSVCFLPMRRLYKQKANSIIQIKKW